MQNLNDSEKKSGSLKIMRKRIKAFATRNVIASKTKKASSIPSSVQFTPFERFEVFATVILAV